MDLELICPLYGVTVSNSCHDASRECGDVYPVVLIPTITASCSGSDWVASLSAISGAFNSYANLPSWAKAISDPSVSNLTYQQYSEQIDDINEILAPDMSLKGCSPPASGAPRSYKWRLLSAIQQHEAGHQTHMLPAINNNLQQLETIVAGLHIGKDLAATQTDAVNLMTSSPQFCSVMSQITSIWQSAYGSLAINDHNSSGK